MIATEQLEHLDPIRLEQAVRDEQARREAELGPNRDRLALLEEGVEKSERKVKRLAADYAKALDEDDKTGADAFREQMRLASRQRDGLKVERDELLSQIAQQQITPADIAELKAQAERLRANIQDADFEAKRYVLDRLSVRVKRAYQNGKPVLELSYLLEKQPIALSIDSFCLAAG